MSKPGVSRPVVAEPMVLAELRLTGFRNLSPLALRPGPRFNVLFGDNGQGKSNLLEGIRYLSALESFRGASSEDLIQKGVGSAELRAVLATSPLPHELEVRLSNREARRPTLDGKRPRSTITWLSVFPTVLFHPGDLVLAQGSPESRRTLLDRILTEMDPGYGMTLRDYLKALRSRNRLLKAERVDVRAVTAFDAALAEAGARIIQARIEVLEALTPHALRAFAHIVGQEVPLRIAYRARVPGSVESMRRALAASLEKDLARGFTADGPHGDDVELGVKAGSAKQHASQGQQRALVLALRVAELEVLSMRTGHVPVLLLDDVSSELDPTRSARFFQLLSELGGQVFLTTTAKDLIQVDGERRDLEVRAGVVG